MEARKASAPALRFDPAETRALCQLSSDPLHVTDGVWQNGGDMQPAQQPAVKVEGGSTKMTNTSTTTRSSAAGYTGTASLNEAERTQAMNKMKAIAEAATLAERHKQKQRDEDSTLALLEVPLERYCPQEGESTMTHMDRLGREMCGRNNSQLSFASEVAEVAQAALAVTAEYKKRHAKAQAQVENLEEDLRDQVESSKDDINELENLEAKVKCLEAKDFATGKEKTFISRGSAMLITAAVSLTSMRGGFQGFCVSALLYFSMIAIAFVLHNESSISKMVQNASNTAQKISRVLSGKAVENDDDSLMPAHMLNGTAAVTLPVSPSAASPPTPPTAPTQGTLRRRKPDLAMDLKKADLARRITSFYKKWAPEKLQDSEFAARQAAKYQRDPASLFKTLVSKYGPEPKNLLKNLVDAPSAPAVVMAGGSRVDTARVDTALNKQLEQLKRSALTQRVEKFYKKWAPEKLHNKGFAARQAEKYMYPGGPAALFKTLVAKYGPEH